MSHEPHSETSLIRSFSESQQTTRFSHDQSTHQSRNTESHRKVLQQPHLENSLHQVEVYDDDKSAQTFHNKRQAIQAFCLQTIGRDSTQEYGTFPNQLRDPEVASSSAKVDRQSGKPWKKLSQLIQPPSSRPESPERSRMSGRRGFNKSSDFREEDYTLKSEAEEVNRRNVGQKKDDNLTIEVLSSHETDIFYSQEGAASYTPKLESATASCSFTYDESAEVGSHP